MDFRASWGNAFLLWSEDGLLSRSEELVYWAPPEGVCIAGNSSGLRSSGENMILEHQAHSWEQMARHN